jgi:MinD superfamily P-loop ATPase
VLIFPELCHGCGSCTLNCPEEAIHEVLNVTGVIEEGQAGGIRFAHGVLNIGEPMAVPVIHQLKKRIGGADLRPHSIVICGSLAGVPSRIHATVSSNRRSYQKNIREE